MSNLKSFAKFAEELFFEKKLDQDVVYRSAPDKDNVTYQETTKEKIIREKYNEWLKVYRETMEAFSIDFQVLKTKSRVHIPMSSEEDVKWILNNHNTSAIKEFRLMYKEFQKLSSRNKNVTGQSAKETTLLHEMFDNKFKKVNFTELQTTIEHIKVILKDQLHGEELHNQLNNLYRNSFLLSKMATEYFQQVTLPSINEEVQKTINFFQNGTTLNDMDRIYLFQYYVHLIAQVNQQFHRITAITDELRNEELVEISLLHSEIPTEEYNSNQIWTQLSDFDEILQQAIDIYKEENQ
ncbi:hypothetical protein D3C87_483040 [compost metagenome]